MALGTFLARCLLVSAFLTLGISSLADHSSYEKHISEKFTLVNKTLANYTDYEIPISPATIKANTKLIVGAFGGFMVSGSLLVILNVKMGMVMLLAGIAGINAFVNNPLMYEDAKLH